MKPNLLFLFLLLPVLGFGQKNLIKNGGFENQLTNWNGDQAKISSMIHKSANASLALVSYVKGKWDGVDQKVNLPKHTQAISISGSFKADNIEQGANPWNVGVIIIQFSNGEKKIGNANLLQQQGGTVDWTSFEKKMLIPEDATDFTIMIALSEASGTFFIDDLKAVVIPVEEVI